MKMDTQSEYGENKQEQEALPANGLHIRGIIKIRRNQVNFKEISRQAHDAKFWVLLGALAV